MYSLEHLSVRQEVRFTPFENHWSGYCSRNRVLLAYIVCYIIVYWTSVVCRHAASRFRKIIPVIYKRISEANILAGYNACDRTRVLEDEWFWNNMVRSLKGWSLPRSAGFRLETENSERMCWTSGSLTRCAAVWVICATISDRCMRCSLKLHLNFFCRIVFLLRTPRVFL